VLYNKFSRFLCHLWWTRNFVEAHSITVIEQALNQALNQDDDVVRELVEKIVKEANRCNLRNEKEQEELLRNLANDVITLRESIKQHQGCCFISINIVA
jgi:hypothetical protein